MFGLPEIGAILRLVFVYRFNVSKMNRMHKENGDKEVRKDIIAGLLFILLVVVIGVIMW